MRQCVDTANAKSNQVPEVRASDIAPFLQVGRVPNMARLKDRDRQIPSGLKYREAITGWRARPYSSFGSIVSDLIELRTANPHLSAKHGWSIDYETVANEVDAFNAKICEKMGWRDYITDGDPSSEAGGAAVPFRRRKERVPIGGENSESLSAHRNNQSGEGAVVAGVRNVVAGIALVADWLGDELIPVDKETATNRAHVCVSCPQNQDPNFLEKITGLAAEELRALIGVRSQMELRTQYDNKLHECKACGCSLKLKVWASIGHIRANMRESVKEQLPDFCWILHESNSQ